MPRLSDAQDYLKVKFKKSNFYFWKRYKVISTVNDLSTGIWFTLGSILFLFTPPIQTAGNICFILGSLQLLARPIIRIIHDSEVKKFQSLKENETEYYH
ncbi:YrhK family protein [Alteribacillus sp. YIM 98480]|uniref:YrhK family protein n=1 Tax=Alteribacillus sp. YIM 98480 TaxID=2606599 RepID=UPI00131D89B9|nr:YrhK family protein [Alteribacillus sp. YIM 98480]